MKFQFKIQQYQTDAVENTVNVFTGQPSHDAATYRRDIGRERLEFDEIGYRNAEVELDGKQLLDNIRKVQRENNIPLSDSLVTVKGMGVCSLDIEMETGTGKTYVYIKTMFELNKRYGWSKFIVVVPSIAIREGVYKSFSILEDHFMEHYGRKARYFVYDSGNLNQLDSFSSDGGIHVMIINTQAFAASLKEGGRSKESRIIYDKRDAFGSRRPIDVIAANRPIIIMDEPQKMEGEATQTGLKRFSPLFVLNYSATHKTRHNTVYALDALDAYQKKLVKRIQVKGVELKNLQGTDTYLYIDSIILSKDKPPMVRIELEINRQGGIRRESRKLGYADDLFIESGLNQYKGYVIRRARRGDPTLQGRLAGKPFGYIPPSVGADGTRHPCTGAKHVRREHPTGRNDRGRQPNAVPRKQAERKLRQERVSGTVAQHQPQVCLYRALRQRRINPESHCRHRQRIVCDRTEIYPDRRYAASRRPIRRHPYHDT